VLNELNGVHTAIFEIKCELESVTVLNDEKKALIKDLYVGIIHNLSASLFGRSGPLSSDHHPTFLSSVNASRHSSVPLYVYLISRLCANIPFLLLLVEYNHYFFMMFFCEPCSSS
jgi:hypothetical protein